jgi:tetratricopeptide (TPR) repeat protein
VRGGNAPVLLVFLLAACPSFHEEHSPEKSAKRLDIAKDFFNKHQLEAAEHECGVAIALNPANAEAYLTRGLVSLTRARDTEVTLEVDNCLTGVDAEATRKDMDAALLKADADFEQAAKINPDYGEAYADRGVVHSLLDENPVAEQYLRKALEFPQRLLDPALTRTNLGWSLFHQAKMVDAAKELREALQFKPTMCVATYRLGRVYFARQEWEKAAESFQTVSDDPSCGSQEASFYLMKTLLQQGLAVRAGEARAACLTLSPKSCLAAECRATPMPAAASPAASSGGAP